MERKNMQFNERWVRYFITFIQQKNRSVADPDPHYFEKLDPDQDQSGKLAPDPDPYPYQIETHQSKR
jgi:hypothetical protein